MLCQREFELRVNSDHLENIDGLKLEIKDATQRFLWARVKRKVWVKRKQDQSLSRGSFLKALERHGETQATEGRVDTVRTERRLSVKLAIWGEVNEGKRGLEIWNWVRNTETASENRACAFRAGTGGARSSKSCVKPLDLFSGALQEWMARQFFLKPTLPYEWQGKMSWREK